MVVSKVRLPLMNLEQLLKVVRPCQILDPDRLLDAIEEKTTSKNLLYRGALCMFNNDRKLINFVKIKKLFVIFCYRA